MRSRRRLRSSSAVAGSSVVDFAIALKGIRSDKIETIKLPGGGIGTGSALQGRTTAAGGAGLLQPPSGTEEVDAFMLEHPDLSTQRETS